ncbi:MAG: hypothetical protein AAGA30_01430 [Planctomycetota bacterium]
MNDEYLQSIRYKLQKRARKLNSASSGLFFPYLKQFIHFIEATPVLAAVRDSLAVRADELEIKETIEKILKGEQLYGETELAAAAIGMRVLELAVDGSGKVNSLDLAYRYGAGSDFDQANEFMFNTFVEPYYEYLDENIDDRQAILSIIRRYKHQCEWFHVSKLTQLAEDSSRGEKSLASNLYEFLHLNGIEFTIEPQTSSGIPDFVVDQTGESKLVADAKIFEPSNSKGKSYLIAGFNQVYTYLKDLNEPIGYLVVYKLCDEDVNFLLPNSRSIFPCLTLNNKTIFICIIDLGNQDRSASKRGGLKSYEVSEADLNTSINTESEPFDED